MVAGSAVPAFDGSHIDGSLFTTVTDFASDTTWLNGAMEWWTNAGLRVFAILMVAGWWRARRRGNTAMTLALAVPVAVVVAFAAAEVVKKVVGEVRPCRSMPHAFLVDTCPAPSDYAFPSGHTTAAAATVAALFLLDRRLGAIATVFAAIEGFTRVYVGAHYPHDVLGSALLAVPVAYATSVALRRTLTPAVGRLRDGALRPVLAASAATGAPIDR
ncbi:phosphatase PAP2 family protein [Actinacidiphila bryophytorum]|uniref:AcidPPc domain-containing protein n=1 Tax=Actinacidiphila bryophytorum TaxID=1436133 RepID=A0A9W4GZ46_9ACTN|nr:phosphatase PAP2 family protein [Actinacidiphila bryophytorum]MBM9435341.1 phosphatase PAP2 family protein [Actinacidiphila bryophytorum]MBN6542172.1 phosphatase PAP2 family protein [Actinacidiphila bryophytorum]CAG7607005.1 acidPPc domain-containing protein [Actinacidiphila bryophytorum]